MHSQKLGVSREGKITHFRSRKSAALFGSPVRAGEEGNGGCQYEWLLKMHVNRPAMGALAEAQLAEGCPSSPGFGSLVLCQLFGASILRYSWCRGKGRLSGALIYLHTSLQHLPPSPGPHSLGALSQRPFSLNFPPPCPAPSQGPGLRSLRQLEAA